MCLPLTCSSQEKRKHKNHQVQQGHEGRSKDKRAADLRLTQENILKPQGRNFFKKHHFLRKSVVYVHSGFSGL